MDLNGNAAPVNEQHDPDQIAALERSDDLVWIRPNQIPWRRSDAIGQELQRKLTFSTIRQASYQRIPPGLNAMSVAYH